ncbi:ATP-binding protein [Streptomyces sp. NPDC046197]|uniref:ATP-binding protein n=1 Tax=Streptomyces sp. NPDC046197 TaxID=3154337 RepID=UPI0033E79B28
MTTFKRHRGLTEQAADAAVDQACRMLRLPTIRAQFPELAEAAARDQMSYRGFLAELLMAECDDRARRRSERRIKAAAFPREKSLRTFDFDANPSVDPAVIHTPATCEWVKKGLPLCLIGDSGTGKSHLLIALGTEAAMAGYRVRYTLATKLVNELVEAADEKVLTNTIARYGRVDLLCIVTADQHLPSPGTGSRPGDQRSADAPDGLPDPGRDPAHRPAPADHLAAQPQGPRIRSTCDEGCGGRRAAAHCRRGWNGHCEDGAHLHEGGDGPQREDL